MYKRQASDLAPGANTVVSRYVAPGANTIAEYERSFTAATTTAGVKLEVLTTSVLLANSTHSATALYGDLDVYKRQAEGQSKQIVVVGIW